MVHKALEKSCLKNANAVAPSSNWS